MNHTNYLNQNRYLCLDGLRCLSILAVIWHHAGYPYWDNFLLASQGDHGVTLFFVISGFLITSLLLKEKRTKGHINLKKFYIRRTLRIFPLYYCVLLIYVLLVYILELESLAGKAFFDNLKYFATYTSNVFVPFIAGDRIIFFFAWSLAAEEQFYLIWPTIERFLSPVVSIPLLIFVIISNLILNNNDISNENIYLHALELIAIPICIGVLLAHALDNKNSYQFIHPLVSRSESSFVFLFFMFLSLSIEGTPITLVYLLMALLIASCVTCIKPSTSLIFENNIVKKIGQISYGMYLLHMLALNVVKTLASNLNISYWPVIFISTTFLTTLFGVASFYFFERHFLSIKRSFS